MLDTVRDEEAYKKWLALKDHPILHDERIIVASDGTEIDPLTNPKAFKKQVDHLEDEEQGMLFKRFKAFKVAYMRVKGYQKEAFGLKKRRIHASLSKGLLDERAGELIEYFGAMYSVEQVHKIIKHDWSYDVTLASVRIFRKTNSEAIDKLILNYKKGFDDVRLSHKRGRLEELTELYNDRRSRYNLTKTKQDYDLLLKTLKLIGEIADKNEIDINHHISGQIDIHLNSQIQQEIMKGLVITDIVIARAAHMMGVNPQYINSRLRRSFYAKNSGIEAPDAGLMSQEIIYPSTMVYNWDEIKAKQLEAKDIDYEELPVEKKEAMSSVKKVLLAKLKEKQEQLAISKGRAKNIKKRDGK